MGLLKNVIFSQNLPKNKKNVDTWNKSLYRVWFWRHDVLNHFEFYIYHTKQDKPNNTWFKRNRWWVQWKDELLRNSLSQLRATNSSVRAAGACDRLYRLNTNTYHCQLIRVMLAWCLSRKQTQADLNSGLQILAIWLFILSYKMELYKLNTNTKHNIW